MNFSFPIVTSYICVITAPVTPASYSRHIRNRHCIAFSFGSAIGDIACFIVNIATTNTCPLLLLHSRGAPPLFQTLSRTGRTNIPLVVSALDESHVCEICRKRFKRLEYSRGQNKTHTGERGFLWEVIGCGKLGSRSVGVTISWLIRGSLKLRL